MDKLTFKDIVILAVLLEGGDPGCFSAAHMDKINLCVYNRLIYRPDTLGVILLVVKLFVRYWQCTTPSSASPLTVCFWVPSFSPGSTAGTSLIQGPGSAFFQVISRVPEKPGFCYFQCVSVCECVCVWRGGGGLPLIYSWPAAHLCIQYILKGRRCLGFDTLHPSPLIS